MSLVNDALRRASEIQKTVPPAPTPDLKLRPIEPAQQHKSSAGFLVVALLIAVLLGGLFLLWSSNQKNKIAAKEIPVAAAAPKLISNPTPAPAPVVQAAPPPPVAAVIPEPTNSVAAEVPAPPKPAPLKLQAVFFNPRNPSAIISGKTVFIGDSIRDFQVVAISARSAILASANETNRLTME